MVITSVDKCADHFSVIFLKLLARFKSSDFLAAQMECIENVTFQHRVLDSDFPMDMIFEKHSRQNN